MKFVVTFKTPDVVDYAVEAFLEQYREVNSEEEENLDDVCEDLYHEMKETASKYTRYGEYLKVEFDTETGTARVLPAE